MIIEDEIRMALLHDLFHKIYKKKHTVDHRLSTSADQDASRMSRHKTAFDELSGEYMSHSFINQKEYTEKDRKEFEYHCTKEYISSNSSVIELHKKLLEDKVVSKFNEVTSMPYSSLKYHTLLVCALHYNYLNNKDFQDLYLNYTDKPVSQYEIIFKHEKSYLVINTNNSGSHIGTPSPYFGQTIGRISNLQFPNFVIENLRRFRSWSVGLQYLDDVMIKLKDGDE